MDDYLVLYRSVQTVRTNVPLHFGPLQVQTFHGKNDMWFDVRIHVAESHYQLTDRGLNLLM